MTKVKRGSNVGCETLVVTSPRKTLVVLDMVAYVQIKLHCSLLHKNGQLKNCFKSADHSAIREGFACSSMQKLHSAGLFWQCVCAHFTADSLQLIWEPGLRADIHKLICPIFMHWLVLALILTIHPCLFGEKGHLCIIAMSFLYEIFCSQNWSFVLLTSKELMKSRLLLLYCVKLM